MNLLETVDQFLQRWVSEELNKLPMSIPPDMATGRSEDDWNFWVPISSTVTSRELAKLEQELGVALSPQHKSLLKHKHFLELQISNVGFFAHPSSGWQDTIKKHVLQGWPRELLLDKGLLPFADYSDWGLWCFAVPEADSQGEYPVYLWDHDLPDRLDWVASTLEAALGGELAQASA